MLSLSVVEEDASDVGFSSNLTSPLVPGCVPAEELPCDHMAAENRSLSGECHHPQASATKRVKRLARSVDSTRITYSHYSPIDKLCHRYP